MIHPALEPFIRAVRQREDASPSDSIEARRQAYREELSAVRGEPELMADVVERALVLEGRALAARLYIPTTDAGSAVVLFFHGGAFVAGDLETHDALCRRLSTDTGMRFLSVDYRLAPEHPFPAAIDDAVDAVRYLHEHLVDFAPEGARIIVMGESAGATIATVACSLVRGDSINVAAQVIIYPTLGPEVVTDSAHAFREGFLLDVDRLRRDYRDYLAGYTDHTDPRVSPLMSIDLSGVAPAIVLVAECDPLRDEAIAYAGLLEHFGVRVELLEAKGMVHGFLRLGGVVPEALEIVDDLAAHMQSFVGQASA